MKKMTMILIGVGIVAIALINPSNAKTANGSSFAVRDSATAILFAEAVIRQEYGVDELKRLSPLTASKKGDRWIVRGDLDKRNPRQTRGGVVEIEIAVDRGTVLSFHYEI